MSVWRLFFGWPAGGIWPNLLASVVTAPAGAVAGGALVWWRARRQLRERLHEHREAIRADVTQQLAAHHQALAEHITAATAPQRGDPP